MHIHHPGSHASVRSREPRVEGHNLGTLLRRWPAFDPRAAGGGACRGDGWGAVGTSKDVKGRRCLRQHGRAVVLAPQFALPLLAHLLQLLLVGLVRLEDPARREVAPGTDHEALCAIVDAHGHVGLAARRDGRESGELSAQSSECRWHTRVFARHMLVCDSRVSASGRTAVVNFAARRTARSALRMPSVLSV